MHARPAHERIASRADSAVVLVKFTTASVFAVRRMVLATGMLVAALRESS